VTWKLDQCYRSATVCTDDIMIEVENDLELGGIPSLGVSSLERKSVSLSPSQYPVFVEDETVFSALANISFRPIQPKDKDRIKALHEEWFPVEYQDDFYNDLAHQRMVHSGDPLYTCLAVCNSNATVSSKYNSVEHEQDEIVACVVGGFVEATKLSGAMQSLLITDRQRHKRLLYIMTLGTVTNLRNAGVATMLIEKCMEQVEQDPSCGVLYLHVITSNHAAIRFYEKLGFYRVREIENYYSIDGELEIEVIEIFSDLCHGSYQCYGNS
jgi:ribosomal protein S18 acetylase RimI-like enzyme